MMEPQALQPQDMGNGEMGVNNNNNNKKKKKKKKKKKNNNNGVLYIKVMTDEQLEILRIQIAVYAVICEQLLQMHKSITAQQHLPGLRLGNFYCDPLVTAVGHKVTARQRWTPTPVQLQILERIFDQGMGSPSKQKIKDITSDLSQLGQISETNVYNWFQNRRARSKRKQQNNNAHNNGESEIETDVESPNKEKKIMRPQEISLDMQSIDSQLGKMENVFASDGSSKPSQSVSPLAFYESILLENPNAGMEHLMQKIKVPENYNDYQSTEDYSMTG